MERGKLMTGKERVSTIDSLRGIAAFAVILYHYVKFIPDTDIPVGRIGTAIVAMTRYGHLGVPVFFVLSGYVIAMTSSRYVFNYSVGARFMLRRLVRIAPPYWVMIGLYVASLSAGKAVGLFRNTYITPGQVAAHLGYAQNLLGFQPLDLAYWTLCLEVQFYIVFAASIVLVRRLMPHRQVGWIMLLTVGSAVINLTNAVPQPWFPSLWYQFGTGVLAYHATREQSARLMLLLLLSALLSLGVYRAHASDFVVAAVAGLLMMVGREDRPEPVYSRTILGLGRISYSLYLVHGFVGLGLAAAFRSPAVRSESAAWVAIALATTIAIALAVAFYQVFERRAIEWSRLVRVGPGATELLATVPG
jgi:peptidoglycan/LPS O-acetylase OafA/YrhL